MVSNCFGSVFLFKWTHSFSEAGALARASLWQLPHPALVLHHGAPASARHMVGAAVNGMGMSVGCYLALRSQRPDHGEGQFVGHRIEAAELLTQQPGKHGDYLQTENRSVSTSPIHGGLPQAPKQPRAQFWWTSWASKVSWGWSQLFSLTTLRKTILPDTFPWSLGQMGIRTEKLRRIGKKYLRALKMMFDCILKWKC